MVNGGSMKKTLISVVVPVYNTEAFLPKCVESILHQTYQNLEIILVDDGSTDKSLAVCEEFRLRDKRVKVLHKERGGQTSARKHGLMAARGEMIAFVDSDDWIEPDMYEKLISCYEETGCDMVSSGFIRDYAVTGQTVCVLDNYEEALYENLEEEIYPTMLYNDGSQGHGICRALWNKLFKRDRLTSVFEKISDRVFYGEDALTLYSYCMRIKSIYILRKAFYHYNVRQGSTCSVSDERLLYNNFLLYSGLREVFMEAANPYALMRQLKRYVFSLEFHNLKYLYRIDAGSLGLWEFSYPDELFDRKFVLYGAGGCGQALFRRIYRMRKEGNMVTWLDKEAAGRTEECDYHIGYPDTLPGLEYDILIVAMKDEHTARQVMESLQKEYAVEKDKLIWQPVRNIPISEGIRF